jgi:hypothetical protein
MTYSWDVNGTFFKTFVVSPVDKVAALANNDQARRSDSPSMEFREKDCRERRRRCGQRVRPQRVIPGQAID